MPRAISMFSSMTASSNSCRSNSSVLASLRSSSSLVADSLAARSSAEEHWVGTGSALEWKRTVLRVECMD